MLIGLAPASPMGVAWKLVTVEVGPHASSSQSPFVFLIQAVMTSA